MLASTKPRLAIIYDFDKTLSPRDMQEYGLIPDLGMKAEDFWQEVNALIDKEEMDSILAYTFLLVAKSRALNRAITLDTFHKMGQHIQFFKGVLGEATDTTSNTPKLSHPGVSRSEKGNPGSGSLAVGSKVESTVNQSWFERINRFCQSSDLEIEHYIVSSGIKEIIEATPIAKYFKKIYACEFLYDSQGCIQWPKIAINYTNKTQFIFRINKGVLEITHDSDQKLNDYTPEEQRRIPFANMIYIGDGFTDVPCMKLVKTHGGHSIAVFDPDKESKLFSEPKNLPAPELLRTSRVNTIVKADYSEGSQLEQIVQMIINKIYADAKLKATVEPFKPLLS